MKRWVRRLVLTAKGGLSFLAGSYLAGSASLGALPVLTTNTLPVICADVVGSQITFVAGFSSDSPATFQWRKNSGGGPVNIPGATNTVLTLTHLQLSDSATYNLSASNSSGVTNSAGSSLTVNPVPAVVNGVLVSPATQAGNGSNLFTPTWSVASGSLLAGLPPSTMGSGNFSQESGGGVVVLTDGVFGPLATGISGAHPTLVTCGSSGGSSLTYTLPASANGYDITNIVVYGGWNDNGRDQQGYSISYSTVASPGTFVPLATIDLNPTVPASLQSATRATIASPTNGPLASNVARVKFDFTTVSVENGYTGYSEMGVYGVTSGQKPVANMPTASPGGSVSVGTVATLNEVATGVPPFQYQWQTDNGSGGNSYADIAGATGSSYVVNTASLGNDTVHYRVRVTDTNGSSISPALFLTVTDPSAPTGIAAKMRCEYLQNPLGIDVLQPRLSWILTLTNRGDHQTAYQVLVASTPAILAQNQGDVWNSGKVVSDQSMLVAHNGQSLVSAHQYFWKVRVWDQDGSASAWSPSAMWSMGLLSPADWSAKWIGMNTDTNILPAPPSPMLRKTFTVSKSVARATAYICGLGYYELQLNGAKVGDHVLDPTWTRYDYQADYVTYDVTTNLVQGQNAMGVHLANGFYNQWTTDAWNTYNAPWRALPQMLLQLDVEYTDGTSMRVISDQTWKASTGPLLLDATRLGEVYDARLEKPGWATAGYDDSTWNAAILREGIAGNLIAPDAEPIRITKTIAPVRIIPVSGQPGVYTLDFGQNLVGWGRLSISGPAGTAVTMVFGEKTNSNGSVDLSNIDVYVNSQRSYFQKDIYTLKGGGAEVWEPRFTYHGFRYSQISGLPSAPTTNTLVARVLNTDFAQTGSFLCSNDLLNRIETNTLWSYLGNFVGIPTDCPHREKNGWTGDAQLACEIGLTHFSSAAAYSRWLREFRPAQFANGGLYGVLPNAGWGANEGPPWESAYLVIPWTIYQHCGDERVLTNNYVGMKAYVDYLTSVAAGNIVSFGLGDWMPASTTTPLSVTGTAYYYQDAMVVAYTAALMGKTAESLQYSNLASQIRTSFNSTFYSSTTKLYSVGGQTAQSAALYFGLAITNQIPAVAQALADNVRQLGNTIDTGILGSKYLLRALCDNGHSDTALALATQTAYPSWGHMVSAGATTLWESWNGSGSIDSLNHVMFGDISAWFMEYLAGIRPGAPGYKTVIIKPEIAGGLAWAQATHESPYGIISSAWQLNGQELNLSITIPPGAVAKVYLPTMGANVTNLVIKETGTTIWQGGAVAANVSGVTFDHFEGIGSQTYSVWSVASGKYQFAWNVLPIPNGLTATAGNRWISLNWNGVPGGVGYNVKRSTTSGGPYTTLVGSLNTSHFNDAPVTNNVTWYYVVSAVYSNGESLNSAEVNARPGEILNAGFETPHIGGYLYTPAGASWNFTGGSGNGSGITANNTGFTSQNTPAPQGTQVGFVQSYSSISQTLSGFTPGSNYTITFAAAQRAGGNQHGGESWNVTMDGNVIGNFNPGPGATSYVDYNANFTAGAVNHTLAFAGTDLATGDNTVFIDNVRVAPSLQALSPTVTLTSPTDNTGFSADTPIDLAATVNPNGNVLNSVQFYANTNMLIGTVTNVPYAVTWGNSSVGNYRIFARAIFNGGHISDSGVANISVTNLPLMIQTAYLTPGGPYFSIGGTGPAGHPVILMTTSNLVVPVLWSPLVTNQSNSNGQFFFQNLATTNERQFYRLAIP